MSQTSMRSLAFLRSMGVKNVDAAGRARVSAARSTASTALETAAAAKAAKAAEEDDGDSDDGDSDDQCSTDLENEFGSASDDDDHDDGVIKDLKDGKPADIRRSNLVPAMVPRTSTLKKRKCNGQQGGGGDGCSVRVRGANHLFDWGPVSFSVIQSKKDSHQATTGVGCAWKPTEFLTNSFNPSRDGTVMSHGKGGVPMDQCVKCIKHWLVEANFHWQRGDELAMKKTFTTAARFYVSSPDASRRLAMVASGLWTQTQADELA